MKHPARAVALGLLTAALAGCTQHPPEAPTIAAQPLAGPTSTQTPTPPPTVAAGATEPPTVGWPQTLTIPKLGVTAPVVGECETLPDGRIEPPADIHATCLTGRADLNPAGAGTTTVTSHTTRAASVGALEHILNLALGDTFTAGGATWTVARVGTYPATALPAELFTSDGPRRLILTTCHLTPAVEAGAAYTDTDLVVASP